MTLEELEIVVKANVEEATKNLDELQEKIREIEGDKTVQDNLKNISSEADSLGNTVENTSDNLDVLGKTVEAITPQLIKSAGGTKAMGTELTKLAGSLEGGVAVLGTALIVIGALIIGFTLLIAKYKALANLIKISLKPYLLLTSKILAKMVSLIKNELISAISTLRNKMGDRNKQSRASGQ